MLISVIVGLITAAVAALLTRLFMPLAIAFHLVDDPHSADRKVHERPIALIGGLAIVCAICIVLIFSSIMLPSMLPALSVNKWIALGLAVVVLFAVGVADDRFDLPPARQILGPIIAAAIVVIAGITISKITNPSGGFFSFDRVPALAAILTFLWLMGMMYSTKLLDGLDGLSSGLSGIGALMIFALTHTEQYYEPRIGFFALIFAGACFGFLTLNFHPARAFLGDGGSLFMGFGLGVLAILSGSKIATTLLVMGLPVIDVARVIIVRRLAGAPIAHGDSRHLHHLLIANGFSHRGAVLLYYAIGILFGTTALFLQSREKIAMLILLVLLGVTAALYLEHRLRKRI